MKNHPPTLLAIFAHPDDESFGPGGTLAKYAAEGVDVHICIATDGAAGSYDEIHLNGYESLAARRRDELEGAVEVLGATLHRLPYRDSGMRNTTENENPECLVQAPLEEVACRIVALLNEVQPHVVLTHDPTGGYFHPDHIKVNEAVLRAWNNLTNLSACPDVPAPRWKPDRLFYTALPRTWVRRGIRLMRLMRKDPTRFGRNGDVDLTELGTPDEQIHVRVDISNYYDTKLEAGQHHASQGGGGAFNWLPSFVLRRLFSKEFFTQAYPDEPVSHDDLLAGLREHVPSGSPVRVS